jgi:hypothetical protein
MALSNGIAKCLIQGDFRLKWFRTIASILIVFGTNGAALAAPRSTKGFEVSTLPEAKSGVSFGYWLEELWGLLDAVSTPDLDAEYTKFVATHHLPIERAQLRTDYQRVRLLFEAVRDGGFWHLKWDVTDQQPTSRVLWKYWIKEPVRGGFAEPSAIVECDELSAFIGMLARQLKIKNVGLFYPTWNHTIAVWAPLAGSTKALLVQLPTTQIFLDCNAGFDKTTFVTQLRNIEPYPNWDVRPDTKIPRERAEWLLNQLRYYASASPTLWSLMRAKRAYLMRSSMGACSEERKNWQRTLTTSLTPGDVKALDALAQNELMIESTDSAKILAWLGQ